MDLLLEPIFSIYRITNQINGKCYIGFTENVAVRWDGHKSYARTGVRRPLYAAMRKYGVDNFTLDVIYCSKDREHTLLEMEPKFIAEYKQCSPGVYNLSEGGANTNTPEMKQRARERMRTNNPMTILRTNRASFQKGRTYTASPEHRLAHSISKTGTKNPNYGKIGSFDHLNKNKLTCPHCGIETTKGNIVRWHLDKCKKAV